MQNGGGLYFHPAWANEFWIVLTHWWQKTWIFNIIQDINIREGFFFRFSNLRCRVVNRLLACSFFRANSNRLSRTAFDRLQTFLQSSVYEARLMQTERATLSLDVWSGSVDTVDKSMCQPTSSVLCIECIGAPWVFCCTGNGNQNRWQQSAAWPEPWTVPARWPTEFPRSVPDGAKQEICIPHRLTCNISFCAFLDNQSWQIDGWWLHCLLFCFVDLCSCISTDLPRCFQKVGIYWHFEPAKLLPGCSITRRWWLQACFVSTSFGWALNCKSSASKLDFSWELMKARGCRCLKLI